VLYGLTHPPRPQRERAAGFRAAAERSRARRVPGSQRRHGLGPLGGRRPFLASACSATRAAQSASGSPRSRRRSRPGTSTQELRRRSDGDRRERVDWGRACGLAELPLSNPRGAISPPPSPILSTRTARWFSNGTHRCVGRGSTCRQGEWNMRRGHDRRRPVDISAPPRKLRKGEVEGTGRESGWRRGESHHRQPTGPSHLPISVGGSESVSPLDRDLAKRGRAA
jgi:hypothetical protein